MKKLLSICLAVLVVVGLVPVYALAAEGDPIDGNAGGSDTTVYYTVNAAATGGSISISSATPDAVTGAGPWTVAAGTMINVKATADEGYESIPTSLTATTGGQTTDITGPFAVTGNTAINAVFAEIENEPEPTPEPEPKPEPKPEETGTTTTPAAPLQSPSNSTPPPTNDGLGGPIPSAGGPHNVTAGSVTGGQITGVPVGGTINDGESLTLTAVADEGYEVKSFTVTMVGDSSTNLATGNTATISSVTGAVNATAEFKLIDRKITINSTGSGTIVVTDTDDGNKTINSGDTIPNGHKIKAVATPNSGNLLTAFTVGASTQDVGDGKQAKTVDGYEVKENITISATFEPVPANVTTHKVTIKAPEDGKITVAYTDKDGNSKTATSGSVDIKDGTKIDVTTTPDTNYKLKTLTIGGTNHNTDQTGVAVTGDITVSASFEYNGGASTPTYVHRPLGVYDDEGDWLEDNSGSSFPRPSSDGKVVLDGVLPNQTFYIKLGDANSDLITTLSGGGKAHASDLADDSLFKISVDKDGDGKSLISKIEQVDEKRLGGMTRASYLKVTLKDMTSTDERKANAEIEFKAKKDKSGSWAKGETAILNLNMWISNTKISGSDGDADTGDKIYFSPEANENNVLIWGDDRAALEFTADDDAKDFYARLSTRSMSDIYAEYGDPVDADLWFYDFVGNPSIPSTSRAYLTLGIPWDDDDDYSPDPRDVYIYRLDKDGYLEDVTAMFTYSEDDREIEGWTTRTRTLGTYIVSDTELDIDSYYDDDDDTEVPSIDVSNNQKPVPNTGR